MSGSLKLCDNPVAEKGGNFATRHLSNGEEHSDERHSPLRRNRGPRVLIMTGQAFADCVLNGKRLPEGTRIVVNSSKEKQFGFYRLGAGGSQAFNNLATTSAALFSLNAQSNPIADA